MSLKNSLHGIPGVKHESPKPPASGETNPGGTTAPAGNGINYSFPAVSTHSKTNRPSLASTPASR
ncbi:hypothetical protein RhiXN_04806 [Rhizoctonia solani]|uniref:Uncharacterized protein n=1 Tax=Rhizoctonia solani TaxID=456999 RepID=A0A8H8NN67_9AGAM|nr:uncharacterized protein RhiXN_04806 [Rhizoctonia solani]QRW16804.1 hypothetical protein RhiXN_04806 [Rhizoctonia solani]